MLMERIIVPSCWTDITSPLLLNIQKTSLNSATFSSLRFSGYAGHHMSRTQRRASKGGRIHSDRCNAKTERTVVGWCRNHPVNRNHTVNVNVLHLTKMECYQKTPKTVVVVLKVVPIEATDAKLQPVWESEEPWTNSNPMPRECHWGRSRLS